MHISLFGATGRVGTKLLERLLENGHKVTALIRTPGKLMMEHDHLRVIEGNALDSSAVHQAVEQCDFVISALNTDGGTTLSASMKLIIDAMEKHGVPRIITIGTAGILQARIAPDLYRFQSLESKRKSTRAAEDHLGAYLLLKQSRLDWTIVCPTYLPDGEATGIYRVEKDMLPENGKKISTGDTADFTYSLLNRHDFHLARIGIAY
jgi:putative NADH-flavin reductase